MKKFQGGGGLFGGNTALEQAALERMWGGTVPPTLASVAQTGLNTVAAQGAQGIGSLFTNPINPLSVALLGQQLYKGYSGRKTAERQKMDNLKLLTEDEMRKAGVDPYEQFPIDMFDPNTNPNMISEFSSAMESGDGTLSPEEWAEEKQLDAVDRSIWEWREQNQDVMQKRYDDFLASGLDYADYKKQLTATTSEVAQDVSGTTNPQDYTDITGTIDVAGIPGDLMEGTYVDPDGRRWGYDMLGRKWVMSEPTPPQEVPTDDSSTSGGGGGGGGAADTAAQAAADAEAARILLEGGLEGGKDFNYEDYKVNPDLYNYDPIAGQLHEAILGEIDPTLREKLIKDYEGTYGTYDPNNPPTPTKKTQAELDADAAQRKAEKQAAQEANVTTGQAGTTGGLGTPRVVPVYVPGGNNGVPSADPNTVDIVEVLTNGSEGPEVSDVINLDPNANADGTCKAGYTKGANGMCALNDPGNGGDGGEGENGEGEGNDGTGEGENGEGEGENGEGKGNDGTGEGDGGDGDGDGTGTGGYGQGVAVITGAPGDVVDLDYLYDISGSSIFAPRLQDEGETDDNRPYVYAKSGGMIHNNYDLTDEILRRLIRGR